MNNAVRHYPRFLAHCANRYDNLQLRYGMTISVSALRNFYSSGSVNGDIINAGVRHLDFYARKERKAVMFLSSYFFSSLHGGIRKKISAKNYKYDNVKR
jgi:hypothetical protein